jgi:hypothetical protein
MSDETSAVVAAVDVSNASNPLANTGPFIDDPLGERAIAGCPERQSPAFENIVSDQKSFECCIPITCKIQGTNLYAAYPLQEYETKVALWSAWKGFEKHKAAEKCESAE